MKKKAAKRYKACAHRFACDRMAALANLLVWQSRGEEDNESIAYAYECDVCREWEASRDDPK